MNLYSRELGSGYDKSGPLRGPGADPQKKGARRSFVIPASLWLISLTREGSLGHQWKGRARSTSRFRAQDSSIGTLKIPENNKGLWAHCQPNVAVHLEHWAACATFDSSSNFPLFSGVHLEHAC